MNTELSARIDSIRQKLADASSSWGRSPEIIAVSKFVEAERVNEVLSCGICHLGENRAQEIVEKLPKLNASFEIDFIGRLQINKVKYIIDKVSMIQSLDRMTLAQEIDKRAQQHHLVMPVLIEVSIAGEVQKGGVPVEELMPFAHDIARLPGLRLEGLMAVMPDTRDDSILMPMFSKMRRLYEQLQEEAIAGTEIRELSMGMSGDYLLAAQAGATHVRIGSAIFGARHIR